MTFPLYFSMQTFVVSLNQSTEFIGKQHFFHLFSVQCLYLFAHFTRFLFIALGKSCFLTVFSFLPVVTNHLCSKDALILTPAPGKSFLISPLFFDGFCLIFFRIWASLFAEIFLFDHISNPVATLEQLGDSDISILHGDAGDAVASTKLKNWPLFGQKCSIFGQSIQLHSRASEVVSIFPTKAK